MYKYFSCYIHILYYGLRWTCSSRKCSHEHCTHAKDKTLAEKQTQARIFEFELTKMVREKAIIACRQPHPTFCSVNLLRENMHFATQKWRGWGAAQLFISVSVFCVNKIIENKCFSIENSWAVVFLWIVLAVARLRCLSFWPCFI